MGDGSLLPFDDDNWTGVHSLQGGEVNAGSSPSAVNLVKPAGVSTGRKMIPVAARFITPVRGLTHIPRFWMSSHPPRTNAPLSQRNSKCPKHSFDRNRYIGSFTLQTFRQLP